MKWPEQANLWRQKVLQSNQGLGLGEGWEVTAKGHEVFFGGGDAENVLKLGCGDDCTASLIYKKPLNYML